MYTIKSLPKPKALSKIYKRDGRLVDFDQTKIETAINKAFKAAGNADPEKARLLTYFVMSILETKFAAHPPNVEQVQDTVEKVLINNNHPEQAKAYIIYRQQRTQLRESKHLFVGTDELKLSLNAVQVLESRYLKKDEKSQITETPMQMFRRVAGFIAKADAKYKTSRKNVKKTEDTFYKMMARLEFIPNSPTLMNADTKIGQLAACFVLPVGDSMKDIFTSLKDMALIHQSGGGTGFSFSRLRPEGDIVGSTKGISSGPLSFMKVYDTATEVIKQGGRRRGANMAILRVDHPDIIKFITAKEDPTALQNFNISVAVTDDFMHAVERDGYYDITNPHTKKTVMKMKAREVFDMIINAAWQTGDPGLIFIDEINRHNPTPALGEIESTNPCGEQPLLPYESCNLGSINLSKFVTEGKIDWNRLKKTVYEAVHFLDNTIDMNKFPLKQTERITKENRKIGLGVMGFADMLIQLGIAYNSEEALRTAERLMKSIQEESRKASIEMAKQRGAFKNFTKSVWKKENSDKMRNAALTTVAPTGSISIIADCSSGIEPLFAVSYVRNILGGVEMLETNKHFEQIAKEKGFYSNDLMIKIAKTGSVRDIKEIPADVRKLFVSAHDISPEWHVRMQAAFQRYTDAAVSKTVNLPSEAMTRDIDDAYKLAFKLKCKGITIYRYGSRPSQTLNRAGDTERKQYVQADLEYSGGCPDTECSF